MTQSEKVLAAIDALVKMGNSEQDAPALLGIMVYDATMEIPDPSFYSKQFVDDKRQEKLTAWQNLMKLPYGKDIIDFEEKLIKGAVCQNCKS